MWQHILLVLLIGVSSAFQTDKYSLNSTFNLVKHLRGIKASNTCGSGGSQLYCLLTGTPLAPGLDYTYSRYPGKYVDGQYCNTCQPGEHNISHTIDENENNWWQSDSLSNIPDFDQRMTIDLDFGQEYQAVYFVLKAANSPRPARWVLERSTDHGKTFSAWQIYVPTDSDCELYYNISASHFPVDFLADDQVLCTSYYSTLNPLENGQIYTSLVVGRPGAELFYLNESPRLQQWMKATNVRLRLEQMQILHNLINDNDDTANRRFFYSIREIIVAGRCSCNGHANFCSQQEDNSVQCECQGNTCGGNCEKCCDGFNMFPWQPSSSGQVFQCQKCQCFGHSENCYYDEGAEGQSVNVDGAIEGGAVCVDCLANTEGLNCERCISGYYREVRESLYAETCRPCDCNFANIDLLEGQEFGSCEAGGQCFCKEQFGGQRCDECRGDHYNTASAGLSCRSCDCDVRGTVSQLQDCKDMSGVCFCKDNTAGEKCDFCRDETFNITVDSEYGCSDCGCNLGGSDNNNCEKDTGQCSCKPGLSGRQCEEVARKHFVPDTDYLSLEGEDGEMRGREALYDYNDGVFRDGFHGKGYATLNNNVPKVDMEIEIPAYTRYKVKISYQLEDSFQKYKGYLTATQETTGEVLNFEATLETCVEGCDVTIQRCVSGRCDDVYMTLTPGTWKISFSYNAPAFNLDRLVFIPRNFEEPYIAQSELNSCTMTNEKLCLEYQLPNLQPYIHQRAVIDPDSPQSTTFMVEDEGAHSIVVDFLYNSSTIDNMTVTVTDGTVDKTGYITLHHCDELQMCRAIVRDAYGQPLVYDSVPGKLDVTFDQDITNPIKGDMYLVVNTEDLIYALKPQYICMTGLDGRCEVNEYPTAHPRTVRDASKGYYVKEDGTTIAVGDDFITSRTNYETLTEICGTKELYYEVRLNLIDFPNYYRIVLEYFYSGLEDLTVNVEFRDADNILVGIGAVTFSPCNGYSGCRTLLTNLNTTSEVYNRPYFRFETRYVLAALTDFPAGKCILLNQLITTLSSLPSADLITPLPLIRTEEFLQSCSPQTDTEFCRNGYLTIAAEFFGGLPECACNERGSLSEVCADFGGQCECKADVIGRTCDRCAAGFFGFPECQRCAAARCSVVGTGFSSVCNEVSGECECAPNVIGERCGQCDADSYGYDDVLGCKDCDCDVEGATDPSCDDKGICFCKKSSITGDKCERCVDGRTNFPVCELCGCDRAGSTSQNCEHGSGQCPCKERVEGGLCDECSLGYYNLQQDNSVGCQECFCFDITNNCTSAPMAYYKLGNEFEEKDSQGWLVVATDTPNKSNSMRPLIEESSNFPGLYELAVLSNSLSIQIGTNKFAWLAPFKGDLTLSYGGKLQFTLGYFPANENNQVGLKPPRIEIKGEVMSLYAELALPGANSYTSYSVSLETGNWEIEGQSSGVLATKTHLMTTLVNVKSIQISGDLTEDMANYRLLSVSLDSAYSSTNNGLALVTHLEQCSCPPGYTGFSCQFCSAGHYRLPSYRLPSDAPSLGECVPCECNGHSNNCNADTGVCTSCLDNTMGDDCELCVGGFYGNPTDGQACQICPCPLPVEGNVFGTCDYDPTLDESLTCVCEAGYEGDNCGTCSAGYYGDPTVIGGACTQCSSCSNNTDITSDYCDRQTGDCLMCLFDTAGDQCEHCDEGYYGDAIYKKNCKPCECDEWGSVGDTTCDSASGECTCLSDVLGDQCTECAPGTWNLTINGVFENTQCASRDCAVTMSGGTQTKFFIVEYTRTPGTVQKITFYDSDGDLTEFVEITDAVTPYWIAGRSEGCKHDHFFNPSVFEDHETVTLEISVSQETIWIYINGKEGSGDRYNRRTSNSASCNYSPKVPDTAAFLSDSQLSGNVTFKSSTQGTGCTSCDCNANGTVGETCDTSNGQCLCHDEVEGYKCDTCKEDFYGLNSLGHCTACDCNEFGSLTTDCDKESGQCACKTGNSGKQCDICDSWAIVTADGCQECPGCSKILKDYMDELSAGIGKTIRLKESGGRVTEDIEQLVFMKNTAILLKKDALDSVETIERNKGIWGTEYPVKSGSIKYQYNKLADYHENTIEDKLEEIEDSLRTKTTGMEEVLTLTEQYNTTYNEINEVLQSSLDLVSNIKISAAEPDVIDRAIKRSRSRIGKMRTRKIYKPETGTLDDLNALNSSVYSDYGSLVGTDLTEMSSNISSLSVSMEAVLANSVASVASPIDEFKSVSEGITGDLSNTLQTFASREQALKTKVSDALLTIDEIESMDIPGAISDLGKLTSEDFSENGRDLVNMFEKDVREREGIVEKSKLLDLAGKESRIERQCRQVKQFMQAPENVPIQVVKELQSFVNHTDVLSATVYNLQTLTDNVTRELNHWLDGDLSLMSDQLLSVNTMYVSLTSQIPNMEGKVTTDDLEKVVSESLAQNELLKQRLADVEDQSKHRTKRYVSRLSVEEFSSTSKNLDRELRRQEKLNKRHQRIKEVMGASETKMSNLNELHSQNEDGIGIISTALGKGKGSINSKIEELKSKPVLSLEEKMKELEMKMSLIKEKMKKVRNEASSVQAGVKMTERSYLKLSMPLVAELSSRYTGVSFTMKTTESTGTVLFLGSRTSTDMFHVRLSGGRLQLKFDIGEGSTTVDTDVKVNDDRWHTIKVSRNGKFGYIAVDSGEDKEIKSFSGANGGTLDLLALDSSGYFFVGCSRETANDTNPEDMFKGSITRLKISNKRVGLWGYLESGGNLAPTQALVKLSEFKPAPRDGLCMKGWGYSVYPCSGISMKDNVPTIIDIKVQTYDRDGPLFSLYNVNTTESLDLFLVDGFPRILGPQATYNPLTQEEEVISNYRLTTISIKVSGKQAILSVNGDEQVEYTLVNSLDWNDLDCKEVWIGGNNRTSISGLIRSVAVNGIKLSLDQQDSNLYEGMAATCLTSKALDGVTMFGSGHVRYEGVDFTENFRIDLRIRTTQPYGVVFFASDGLGFNTISLSVDNGQVEFVAMRNYAKTAVRTGQDVSNGNWHEVSIVRDGDKITLNLDGFTSSTMLRENVVYPTNHGFWVGGVPYNIPLLLDVVPQLLPFEGAVRSLAINTRTIDLNNFVEAQDVSLAGTSIRQSTKTYHTVE